jgi:hypothetical protein
MAIKLMSLRHVPADELDEIYALLDEHGIDFYETRVSAFAISTPALWLRDETQYAAARQLLDDYAVTRLASARETLQEQQRNGTARTMLDLLRERPLRFLFYLVLVVALVYFSIVPFWTFPFARQAP